MTVDSNFKAADPSPSRTGVFICSSDSRTDILERVLPSVLKFWSDCPYRIYVGRNTKSKALSAVTAVLAPPSEWRKEFLEQIAQIDESHLILLLDDYLFQRPVDQTRVSQFVSYAVSARLPYLRLLPLRISLLNRLVNSIRSAAESEIKEISIHRPFFSGLQAAVWDKSHLSLLLQHRGSIWNFEHRQISGVSHFAVTAPPPIVYSHLVEKGRWLPYAKRLLIEAGLPPDLGDRQIWPYWMHLRLYWDELRFLALGYANH